MYSKSYLTLVSLFFLSTSAYAASSCIAFDVNWNLLAFNLNGKDWNAGTQDTWASGSATDITASGRPPFDGTNLTCYLSQFGNAIYVMGGDKANPANIGIYDATAKSWSTQTITAGKFDPTNFVAVLDHDTDVFYALSNGELFDLVMNTLKTAKPDPIPWTDVETPPWSTTGYQPVMALAQNHVHFLNVPGVAAGSVQIFVIHFSFFQPDAQKMGAFPATHGQTASIFLDDGAQQEFVFVPDDGSQTYVINVETNTTQTLAGPTSKNDAGATYFGAPSSIVQLASSGAVSWLAYNPNNTAANAAATWSPVQNLASVAPPGSSSSSSNSSSGSSGSSGSSNSTGGSSPSGSGSSGSTGGSTGGSSSGGSSNSTGNGKAGSGSVSLHSVSFGMATALLLGAASMLLY